jgi:xanthine dehydrogenase accessory factor
MPLAVKRRVQAARGAGVTGTPALIGGWLIEPLAAPTRKIWIWGAGHVGRALVAVLAPLPDLALTWVDTSDERFPAPLPAGVEKIVAADPARLVPFAPEAAEHLILTYSHVLDLALCHALLSHGFAAAGLIGSATKWARFRRRLSGLGHSDAQITRIACPIGDPTLGKHPQAIAISVGAAILAQRRAEASIQKTAV